MSVVGHGEGDDKDDGFGGTPDGSKEEEEEEEKVVKWTESFRCS